ncbi:MAG: glutathione S-transferase family protein [Gammaproteobacteria bacterium]
MDLELISFELCPYVQRAVITLLYKQASFTLTHIDLADPPKWFLDISPFGKVPVLRVNGKTIIFESAVINEYIDEVFPDRLHPADPLQRALNRSWIEFGSACLIDTFRMINAKTADKFADVHADLLEKLQQIEEILGAGPYFNGNRFSLVDAAYAPLFARLELLGELVEVYVKTDLPKAASWSETLLVAPAVQRSQVAHFSELYYKMIRNRGGHLASLVPSH